MQLTYSQLKGLIRKYSLVEATQYYEDVMLTSGESSKYGDQTHISDMESLVSGMECLRDQQRRGTAARSIYATAVRQLKGQIKNAKIRAGGGAVEPESESEIMEPTQARSIEVPGKSRRPRPGFDGGRSTSPGHGRYEPGNG